MLKSKFTQSKSAPAKDFPKLMIDEDDGQIVFFSEEATGITVYSDEDSLGIGEYSDTWDMSCFTDFYGSITMEQK